MKITRQPPDGLLSDLGGSLGPIEPFSKSNGQNGGNLLFLATFDGC